MSNIHEFTDGPSGKPQKAEIYLKGDSDVTFDVQFKENINWDTIGEAESSNDQISTSSPHVATIASPTNKEYTIKMYEYDPSNEDEYVGSCKVGTTSTHCYWTNVDAFADGGNGKAELYIQSDYYSAEGEKISFEGSKKR
ncbi:hypothetical protein [Mechercharimyces sp. CAU 1602]|uniref:hypothetical protein n=1 Tax=Mechercharimyces sp. CAU 1602 TaxID=2973933 RepID=UPI0021624D5F|nr:hypothetical protein [Mechercharimyces sp. CAU 1602]